MKRVVVIGAGVGGLAAAAVLARSGFDVLVLEAHIYPGGCAGTFFHQGYRFDAGATLAAGFYPGGPMDLLAQAAGIAGWEMQPANPCLVVHLPDGSTVTRWTDDRRYAENRRAFGEPGVRFFDWQEQTADALWDLALSLPPWPPQSSRQLAALLIKGAAWLGKDWKQRLSLSILADVFQPVAVHLEGASDALRQFVDGQLLISAQAPGSQTNALYGASALDLPRRGVVHLEGGMGAIAEQLVQAVREHGGKVQYRWTAERVLLDEGLPVAVEARHGNQGKMETFPADFVIANLPPWNVARLLGEHAPARLKRLPEKPRSGWGAFMVYVGFDGGLIPVDFPLHHQVITGESMGEGRTVFLSISPDWDARRAPQGRRALTISTHTRFDPWWDWNANNREMYDAASQEYTDRILEAAERVIPGLRQGADLILPGTPVTFERFTRRAWGWVGGFPQVNLFQNWGPRIARNIWMVGDSIFPGQSTAAVALGGMRVAEDVWISRSKLSAFPTKQERRGRQASL